MFKKSARNTEMINKKKKPFYKRWWFIALVILFILGSLGSQDDKNDTTTSKLNDNVKQTETTKKEKASKSSTEKKSDKNIITQEQKDNYKSTVYTEVQNLMTQFDQEVANSKNTVAMLATDRYTAYDNAKNVHKNNFYEIADRAYSIERPKYFDKEHKEMFDEMISSFQNACYTWANAMDQVADIANSGQANPEDVSKYKDTISLADSQVISFSANYTGLNFDYGAISADQQQPQQ